MTAVEMVTRAGRAYYGISHAIACYTKASRGLSATAEFLLFPIIIFHPFTLFFEL